MRAQMPLEKSHGSRHCPSPWQGKRTPMTRPTVWRWDAGAKHIACRPMSEPNVANNVVDRGEAQTPTGGQADDETQHLCFPTGAWCREEPSGVWPRARHRGCPVETVEKATLLWHGIPSPIAAVNSLATRAPQEYHVPPQHAW